MSLWVYIKKKSLCEISPQKVQPPLAGECIHKQTHLSAARQALALAPLGQRTEIDSIHQPSSDDPVESVNLQLTVKLFSVLYYSTFCFMGKADDA